MTDCFALLEEPRRPWVDPELLRRKFLAMSARFHPDHVHQAPEAERRAAEQMCAELSAAYQCLRETGHRLRHLLELERGEKPPGLQQPGPELADLIFETGALCRQADGFLAQKAGTTSPVLQAALFEQSQSWTDRLQAMQQKLNTRRDELETELKSMNAAWESVPETAARSAALPLKRLEELCRLSGYLARWSEQVQERLVQLAL